MLPGLSSETQKLNYCIYDNIHSIISDRPKIDFTGFQYVKGVRALRLHIQNA